MKRKNNGDWIGTRKWRLAQKLELWWWDRYLQKQSVEDYLEQKKNYWQRILQQIAVSIPKGAKVLDAGCGPAGIFMILDQIDVTALDPLLSQYESQLAHFSKAMYPGVQFEESPLELFQTQEQYDLIFCLNAINHVSDLETALDGLIAALKPGGQLILSTDVHRHSFLKKLFRWLPGDLLHPQQNDLEEYKALLTRKGIFIAQEYHLRRQRIFDYYLIKGRKS